MHLSSSALLGDMNWQTLAIPAAGVAVAMLVLGVSLFFVNKRKAKSPTQPAEAVPDPFLQGPQSDRRQSPRRAGQSIKVTIQLVNEQKTEFEGYVMDRSMGGLRLMLDRHLATNQMLNVRSTDAPQTVTWVQVQVRRVTQLPDKSYEVGCQFIRTPPWAVLLTFG
jgi:hypothetical protein